MHSDFAQLSSLTSVDADYRFGRPKVYLTSHELARLTIVRSKLGDTCAEREAEATPSSHRPARQLARQALDVESGQLLA
jgi:hypothetical protein